MIAVCSSVRRPVVTARWLIPLVRAENPVTHLVLVSDCGALVVGQSCAAFVRLTRVRQAHAEMWSAQRLITGVYRFACLVDCAMIKSSQCGSRSLAATLCDSVSRVSDGQPVREGRVVLSGGQSGRYFVCLSWSCSCCLV